MIPQTSEYALRAVVHLARVGGGPATAQEIATATKVSMGYLQKVLRTLARGGLVLAQRGTGGGFSLARPASEISVLDVVALSDGGLKRIVGCPLGIPGHTALCALHRLLDDAMAETERVFRQTSVADLLSTTKGPGSLCSPPPSRGLPVRSNRTPPASNGPWDVTPG